MEDGVNYIDLLRNCGYGNDILDIASGKIEVPEFTFEAPFHPSYGFPPALIPLWSNGDWPGYVGLVKHWFGKRPDTFVQFYVEDFIFKEVAKNLNQLKAWMVFDFLRNVPDFDEVGRFAESFVFCKAEEIGNIFADCKGKGVYGLRNLDAFAGDLPAALKDRDQSGEPDWLSKPADVDEIVKLIENRQFELAWYKLNSSDELANADILNILKRMSPATGDKEPFFNDLISCWEDANIWPKGILNG